MRAQPQLERGEFLAAHAARRWLADNASQVASILNAAALTPADPVVFNEGDWVLFECEAAPVTPLDPPYTGPHVVLHVERTPEGVPTGFYTIAKVLANEQRGPPRRTRSSKLWPFDASRTTGDFEHQRQLPADMVIVKAVLEHGPTLSATAFSSSVTWGATRPRGSPSPTSSATRCSLRTATPTASTTRQGCRARAAHVGAGLRVYLFYQLLVPTTLALPLRLHRARRQPHLLRPSCRRHTPWRAGGSRR